MATYLDKSQWEDQILIPDEQTPILGGQPEWDSTNMLSGWSNVPAGMLADRTRFLHDRIQEIEQDIEQGAVGSLKRDNNLSDLQDVGQAKFNLGLNLVDNVRDADKPVSTATQAALNTKVDKVAGKQLSANDYTTPEKNKLAGIESGAQVNVATNLGIGTRTSTNVVVTSSTGGEATLPVATTALAGTMSAADKTKLDGIATGATANATNAQLRDRTTHTGEQAISTITGLQTALNNKVDKASGMGLSQENFTTSEKSKLAGLESSKFKGEFTSLTELQSAFPTAPVGSYAYVDQGVGQDVVKYIWDTTDTRWVLQQGESAVLTPVDVKSLYEANADTNAFTNTEKTKLAGIANNANNYVHPNSGVNAGTYKSVTVNAQGHVTGGSNPTTLSGFGITDAAPLSHVGSTGSAHGVATPSVAGFMSAADKQKLNGISDGAGVPSVTSVAGKQGAVTLVKADVGLGNVDNTADSVKNVASAAKLTTARSISATGDAAWSVNFDGTGNASAALTLASSGVTAGTYPKVTVDAKGRVTAGSAMVASDVPALNASKAQVLSGTNNVYVSGGSYLNVISWNNIGSISVNTSINLDASLNHNLTATASLTLDAINVDPGKTGDIIISTPTAVTISWAAKWKFLGSVPNIGGAGETWVVSYKVVDASNIYASAAKVA